MTTTVYKTETIQLVDGTELELSPLKIKYLREFMEAFKTAQSSAKDQDEALLALVTCTKIAMKQFMPSIKTVDDVEENFDLKTMYKLLNIVAGIKMGEQTEGQQVVDSTAQAAAEKSSWDDLDLAKIESEVFILGMWKNYEELETNMSMPELLITLETSRELDYNEKRFLAAMQGVDLDEEVKSKEPDPWEAMKARVATNGLTSDPNDIVSFQGIRAAQSGFGIGMGLEYSTEL
ncbi:hypothetical protein UFOVP222_41 [uncultured Caudovirales phage]|uniref:Tail assembly chaperone n=1 Tax=uncultured Caudovirales phage TaxID=2100421 RepID=A0A6J7WSW7_9CAUD|nr:hypothetical protein UFOVP108_36 [uncultured Caudovirales phage]CAB5219214.1 hypothetical protein UFOVP222_41 [uncultured Caudovirales phage]